MDNPDQHVSLIAGQKRGKVDILETAGIAEGISLIVFAPERGGHCRTIVALN